MGNREREEREGKGEMERERETEVCFSEAKGGLKLGLRVKKKQV